jgi:uncharacterized protein (DUF488 family)
VSSIWTIGHSTRTIEEFLALLRAHSITLVVDVRQFPGSQRYPHFNKEPLARLLVAHGIKYLHIPELGGRRRAKKYSVNTAWRNAAFRGYADYMETTTFAIGMDRLAEAANENTVIMCAEAVWWRCHRALISDYLKATGVQVFHILDAKKIEPHPFTSVARVVDGELSYRPNHTDS